MFGKDIKIQLNKYQFAPEDTISGTVILEISKAVKANGLIVSLVVQEKTSQMRVRSSGVNMSSSQSTAEVFRFDLPLDGEKEYTSDGKYPFTMQIPREACPAGIEGIQKPGGILGKGIGLLANFSPLGKKTRMYQIEARLDIPWGLDLTESADITIQ